MEVHQNNSTHVGNEKKSSHSDHPLHESGFDAGDCGSTMQPPPFQLKADQPDAPLNPNPNANPNPNENGLPLQLKTGIEQVSGMSMNDVSVKYDSDKPVQLQAHAFAQGNEIHLGPGQEKHLPHEAWHVVQQKQGRVQPTTELNGNVRVNDDAVLEKEADEMGAKVTQAKFINPDQTIQQRPDASSAAVLAKSTSQSPIQRKIHMRSVEEGWFWDTENLTEVSQREIDAYIADIGVGIHDFDDIISATRQNGTPTEYSFVQDDAYRLELIQTIVRQMHTCSEDLYFDNYREGVVEIRKRALTSLRMRASQGRSRGDRPLGYPAHGGNGQVSVAGRPYYDAVPRSGGNNYHFVPTPMGKANAYEALEKFLFDSRTSQSERTLLHCDYILTAMHLMNMAESMGISTFNARVSAGEIDITITALGYANIRQEDPTGSATNQSLQRVELNSENDMIIGDHVIFWNHAAYNDLNRISGQSWRLENAIVIDHQGGEPRFQGHGFFSPHTRAHFVDAMVRKINMLVQTALGHLNQNNEDGLRNDFRYSLGGNSFHPIGYEVIGGQIRNAKIRYHENGLWDSGDMSNSVIEIPLQLFSAADFANPFARPGSSTIVANRPIESRRATL